MAFLFNRNCAIMEDYERRYFVDNSIEQNNRSLINTLDQLLDPILYSADLAVAKSTWKIEWVVAWQIQAKEFAEKVGLRDYNNRHCRCLLRMAMNEKKLLMT